LILRDRLEALGRLAWFDEDCAALLNPALYDNPPELAWKRVRGVQVLAPRQLPVLQALAAWREAKARERNLPRAWVLKDEVMCGLASLSPEQAADLPRIQGLDGPIYKRYGAELLRLVRETPSETSESDGTVGRPLRMTSEQKALMKRLTEAVRLKAAELDINPSVLASRKDLESLMDNSGESRLLKGWRKAVIGESLAVILAAHAPGEPAKA